MECNKEDAAKAREIAKRKFLANDISGATKFAAKAEFLNPQLDGIAKMVATFNVHHCARNKIYGQIDYYGILKVNPEADHETVRKSYKKLAVMIHPDRNLSVGADEAFKFLSQAWSVLSDKEKRADYDMKRNVGLFEGGGPSSSRPTTNGFQKVTKASGNTTKVKSSKRGIKRANDVSAVATAHTSAKKTTADGTFWTVCRTCRTQYEYHRVYLNQNLLCPNCRKPFIAVETDPPASGSVRKTFHEHQFDSLRLPTDGRKKNIPGRDNSGMYDGYDSFEWGVFTGTKNAAQTGPRKEEAVRREHNKRVASFPSTIPPKRRKVMENVVPGANVASCVAPKSTGVNEFTEDELKNLLKKKAKSVISRNLQELCTIVTETDTNQRGMESKGLNGFITSSSVNKVAIETCFMDSIKDTSATDKDVNSLGALSLYVPDPDFCDFNKDRTEKSFRSAQIWASYDFHDGMPRSYLMIHNVISIDPFKVRMSCLTSVANGEIGIPKSCGAFRIGETQICRSPYIFSHKVNLIKGNKGEFLIYPRKGDVWALYRKWSSGWNYYLTGTKTVEYDIVEVVEGYTEEYGVSVVPLVKVAGFNAVFHHHLDLKQTRKIHKDEISRFSHKIPSYLLTGREAPDAPRGCRQLDPAATPSQLLQAIDD